MLTISHPRPEPGRVRFLDVEFIDGVATVESLHPVRRAALEQHGFTVTPAPAHVPRPVKPTPRKPRRTGRS